MRWDCSPMQFQELDILLRAQWQVVDTPAISVTSCGHPLDSSVTSCGHPPGVSVSLIARILKKKLKMRMKTTFFTIFTILIVFLRVFYVIYVKMSFHVIVPLRWVELSWVTLGFDNFFFLVGCFRYSQSCLTWLSVCCNESSVTSRTFLPILASSAAREHLTTWAQCSGSGETALEGNISETSCDSFGSGVKVITAWLEGRWDCRV